MAPRSSKRKPWDKALENVFCNHQIALGHTYVLHHPATSTYYGFRASLLAAGAIDSFYSNFTIAGNTTFVINYAENFGGEGTFVIQQ